MNQDKKYLNFGQKLAYASGDFGGTFCYSLVSSFFMIYLTNYVGLNAGIIGTLMLAARLFDGVSDVLAGNLIDRTNHRLGKARPWMLFTILPTAICEILLFSIPSIGEKLQYAYIFIIYVFLNAVFYTIYNVAYMTLIARITKNKEERVQTGVIRFIFTCVAGTLLSSITLNLVEAFGNNLNAWRIVTLIYASAFTVINLICVYFCKELPATEFEDNQQLRMEKKVSIIDSFKYLAKNKFFLEQLGVGILNNITFTITLSVGVYYMMYVIKNASLYGTLSLASSVGMIVGLLFTPQLVKRLGLYKTNLCGYFVVVAGCILFMIFSYRGQSAFVPMIVTFFILSIGRGPQTGTQQALISEIGEYTWNKDKVRLEGIMFSSNTVGVKVGSGIGTALLGWMLELAKFDGTAAVQSASAIHMIKFLFSGTQLIACILIMLLLSLMKVEKANQRYNEKTDK